MIEASRAQLSKKISNYIDKHISTYPLFRKKIEWVPTQNQAVWIDDPNFRIEHHIRHIRLPSPAKLNTFKAFSADLVSRTLPRNAPLWDIWIIEGLRYDSVQEVDDAKSAAMGIIARIHHAMMDGVGALSVLEKIFQSKIVDMNDFATPGSFTHQSVAQASIKQDTTKERKWMPAKAPSKTELFTADILQKYARIPTIVSSIATSAQQLANKHVFSSEKSAKNMQPTKKATVARQLIQRFERDFSETTQTSLNPRELNQERDLDWHKLKITTIKSLAKKHHASVNDAILAITTLSLKAYFRKQKELRRISTFRALTPLNIRTLTDAQSLGNKLGILLVDLPLHLNTLEDTILNISAQTKKKKGQQRSEAKSIQNALSPILSGNLIGKAIQTVSAFRPYNVVVTNVPGPSTPLFLGNSRLHHCFPTVPLYKGANLGIAVFSYCDHLYLGLVTDPLSLLETDSLYQSFSHVIESL